MKKIGGLLAVLFSICLISPLYADDSNDDNTGRDDKQVYHVYNDVDLISNLKIQYDRPRIVIKSVYPELDSGDEGSDNISAFNDLVTQTIQDKIADFKKEVQADKDSFANLPKSRIKNDLFIDYDTSFMESGKNAIISIRFSQESYIAGSAHPAHLHFVLNYNLKTGEEIQLADLFNPNTDYLTVIANYANTQLNRHLPDKQFIEAGTAPKEDNYKNWNIKSGGILFTFEEGQVAPRIQGAQSVLVPYSLLKELISPDAPIANCANSKKRCARNNLVTGGFIDAAAKSTSIQLLRLTKK